MPSVTFVSSSGRMQVVDVVEGESLMHAAVANDVQGIVGECGGCLACGTCHVFIDSAYLALLPPPQDDEIAMLDFVSERKETSRLCCQIRMTEALDGMRVATPETQGADTEV